ncbi:MAG: hypothetical protein K2Q27_05285 [Novosphingobium sp.]|nr:hypothetical protein [Novosphingobium sp.]
MTTTLRIVLPWPPAALFPNARVHHMAAHRAKRPYRAGAKLLAQDALRAHGLAGGEATWPGKGKIPIVVTVLPPHNRHDDDNRYAATKAARDGVADGLGVNDKRFQCSFQTGGVMKGGAVVLDVPVGADQEPQERVESVGRYQEAIPDWMRS